MFRALFHLATRFACLTLALTPPLNGEPGGGGRLSRRPRRRPDPLRRRLPWSDEARSRGAWPSSQYGNQPGHAAPSPARRRGRGLSRHQRRAAQGWAPLHSELRPEDVVAIHLPRPRDSVTGSLYVRKAEDSGMVALPFRLDPKKVPAARQCRRAIPTGQGRHYQRLLDLQDPRRRLVPPPDPRERPGDQRARPAFQPRQLPGGHLHPLLRRPRYQREPPARPPPPGTPRPGRQRRQIPGRRPPGHHRRRDGLEGPPRRQVPRTGPARLPHPGRPARPVRPQPGRRPRPARPLSTLGLAPRPPARRPLARGPGDAELLRAPARPLVRRPDPPGRPQHDPEPRRYRLRPLPPQRHRPGHSLRDQPPRTAVDLPPHADRRRPRRRED